MSVFKRNFPFYKQLDSMDCGPSCLRMIAKHYGKNYSLQFLREKCYIDRTGVSLKGIAEAAETVGFRTLAVKVALTPPPFCQYGRTYAVRGSIALYSTLESEPLRSCLQNR